MNLRNALMAAAFFGLVGSADAGPFVVNPGETLVAINGQPIASTRQATKQLAVAPRRVSLAQSKANRMARSGVMRHLGGGFGGGRFEGVGTGGSRQAAISNCCYWGRRTPIDIGAATNGRNWFACVIYR